MSKNYEPKLDPVCVMQVDSDEINLTYAGIEYWFCSDQCRQRFIARPHLFIGSPKQGLSVKQRGKESLRAHYIHLKIQPNGSETENLREHIQRLMGIKDVDIKEKTVLVIYDLIQVSLEDIERAIIEAQCVVSTRITDRLKRTIIHFAEECDLDNLARL